MQSTRTGRVFVYSNRSNWKVEVRRRDGTRTSQTYKNKAEAEAIAARVRKGLDIEGKLVSVAVDEYVHELATVHDRKPGHTKTTEYRLGSIFPTSLLLPELTAHRAQVLYDELRARVSVDTHRNTLAQAKTFCGWLVKNSYLAENPFANVEGVGRRTKGKTQLTIDESRKLMATCIESEDVGATATLCCLVLGLRAGEVADIVPRSIDNGGTVLRVDRSKTAAGVRLVEIPEMLRGRMEALAEREGKDRHWVAGRVRAWCKAAKVTPVGPHALRGTHASLATQAGATSQLVASTLGHASTRVTEQHYTKADVRERVEQGARLKVLAGGRS